MDERSNYKTPNYETAREKHRGEFSKTLAWGMIFWISSQKYRQQKQK